ncbi:Rad2 nuclease [Mactra antiquata]
MEAGPSSGRKSTNLRTIATTHAGRVVQQMEVSSFINPMNLSLDFTLTEQEDECDPDYVLLVDMSASLSTSDFESFHQFILMYCAKRYAYTSPVYRIRNLLAALDHNHHADKPMKLDKHGEQSLIQVSQIVQ